MCEKMMMKIEYARLFLKKYSSAFIVHHVVWEEFQLQLVQAWDELIFSSFKGK